MKIVKNQARGEFKNWVKDFLSHHVEVKPSDVWTLDLIANTIAAKYDKETSFLIENGNFTYDDDTDFSTKL